MPGELTPISQRVAARRHVQAVSRVQRASDLAQVVLNETAVLEQTAVVRLAETASLARQAAEAVPEYREAFGLVVMGAALNMRQIVNRFGSSL